MSLREPLGCFDPQLSHEIHDSKCSLSVIIPVQDLGLVVLYPCAYR